jgi:hypothetical protein
MSNFISNVRIFRFDSKNEAIEHYINMNENITHSAEDIEKAISMRKRCN